MNAGSSATPAATVSLSIWISAKWPPGVGVTPAPSTVMVSALWVASPFSVPGGSMVCNPVKVLFPARM